jgi:hypothetical protein
MSSETCTPTNPSNLGWSSSDTLSSRIQTRTTGRFNFHARKLFIFSLFDKRATDSSFRHSCGIRGRGNQYKPGHPASRPPFLTLFAGSKEGGKQKTESRVHAGSVTYCTDVSGMCGEVVRLLKFPTEDPYSRRVLLVALLPQVRVRPRQASHIHVSSLPPWILASAVNHP